jgi:hypothetical protein
MADAERASFVCAWTVPYRPDRSWARGRVTWPLGRVRIGEGILELSIRGPGGALLAAVSRLGPRAFRLPVSIPLEQVQAARRRSSPLWFAILRLEISGTAWDGTSILVRRRDLDPLLDAIEAGGARLRSAPTRTEED